ncbi:hypothetical protein BVC71_00070 [Marivivens niveibacter]|uniref:Rhamnogalacturonase A/B/Epimerase-like pectate lyase domain-containing protein n=1 Tax=Marivivens niveibacter TaxID=1930667 RepID=A0A251X2Y4_9RHOB|nr:glycosyl hydrolase family 28-related protein [Marivivens niveibacter]OUD10972.1 hypothetical protein BVC71_00070 [Marivivens niveibacter]
MNKAITDGLQLMPPAFADGLGVWSSGDGTAGSDTYAGSGEGVYVSADQNFAGCIEILSTSALQKLRYMGQTTILPGCYLRITARVKAISGPLPQIRIAGWAGGAGDLHVEGLTETGPETIMPTYGEVVEVSAIVGTGARTGVDMVWSDAIYGHFGIDIISGAGGVIRVDDITIEDVTTVFLRDMMGVVDVRDYGAKGDGVTDDSAAFEAADADANGREVLVSAGTYYLGEHVTIENQIRFEGTITMPESKRILLQKNYDFATYADAFGNEEIAFKKAFQALLNNSGHESLDLCGRRIQLSAPIDMQAAEGSKTSYATRRVIRNGQFEAVENSAWDTVTVTSQATYSADSPRTLTGVTNVANIAVGSLVSGNGVGREIYVKAVNVAAQTVTINKPLYDAEGTQVFTFDRFQYLLDFSGFESLSNFIIDDVELNGQGRASCIMLAKDGSIFHVRDCFINKPANRGLTSIGGACQGLTIDRCQFLSNEMSLPVAERVTIGFNANMNDVKIRDCRVVRFKHFCTLAGTGNLITGNHWFHGDGEDLGVRKGGIIFTSPNCKSIITGNYIDNNFIEMTNEHDATPALGQQYSFGGLTMTGNIFTANNVASWFNFIVIKPFGTGHFVHGLSVTGNTFRSLNGNIQRVETVDTTFADLDYSRMRNVLFYGNTFNGVTEETVNPAMIEHSQSTASRTWVIDTAPTLPFGGRARVVETLQNEGSITNGSNSVDYSTPWIEPSYGTDMTQIAVNWQNAVKGTVWARVRMDKPL